MIKDLTVKFYQSHHDTYLRFCNGINVIFGSPNHGKTAIIRAIELVAKNRPLGFKYNTRKQDEPTQIILSTDKGKVEFNKSTNETVYRINDGEFKFTKVGKDVPDKVLQSLNLSELNIQKQFDSPFLITSSAGKVAEQINRITKVELFDEWISELTKKINAENRYVKKIEEDLESAEQKLKIYDGLEVIEGPLNRLELVVKEKEDLVDEENELYNIVEQLENISIQNKRYNIELKQLKKYYVDLNEIDGKIRSMVDEYKLLTKYVEVGDFVWSTRKKIMVLERRSVQWREILDQYNLLTDEENRIVEYIDILEKIDLVREDGKQMLIESEKLKKQYAKELGSKCPVCFTELDDNELNKIMEQL